MEILSVFLSDGGGEVNIKTDGGFFAVTRSDFRRFVSEYTDENPEELLSCDAETARELFPVALDAEGEEELAYLNEKLRALRYALYLLGISDKSTKQLLFKLKQKGYSERAVNDAAAVLMQNDRLSDEAFCRRKCEILALGKHYGRARIVRELCAKGIPSALCERVLDDMEIDFDEQLQILCEKLIREPITDREMRQKTIAKLTRYGYGYEEISDCLSSHFSESEDDAL